MYLAIILCSALCSADADTLTVRVVNTLEEPVAIKFRIVGKEAWLKEELALDSAQTKNFDLPKGDKYEVVVRDQNKKEIPVGSWDFGKMLAKDAKFEVHVVDAKENPARGSSGSLKKPKSAAVDGDIRPAGKISKIFRRVRTDVAELEAVGEATPDAPANPKQRVELSIFSGKKYFLIDEFVEVKKDAKSADPSKPGSQPIPDSTGPVPIAPTIGPPPTPAPALEPIRPR